MGSSAAAAAALDKLTEIEAHRARRGRTNRTHRKKGIKPQEPRASTTDPDARVMKMADGGFRPAYNVRSPPRPAVRSWSLRKQR
jgi:hypothetical protein